MDLGYVTEDTVRLMIQKAGSHEKKMAQVISGEVVEELVEEKKEETKAPEPKKEETVDASAGLASMFG